MSRPLADLYPDWPQDAARIRDAVAGLDAAGLDLRAGPDHAPIWALAAHVAGTRVCWLCGVFGEPGAQGAEFMDPTSGIGWEDDVDHPRTGAELAWALDAGWSIAADVLSRWTVDDLDLTATRIAPDGTSQVHTRASVLDRLLSHDAFHGGEISQLLGRHDLPPIDLWRRRPG
jgi:hypothetical protein